MGWGTGFAGFPLAHMPQQDGMPPVPLLVNLAANRPNPSYYYYHWWYFATDTPALYVCTGSAWQQVAVGSVALTGSNIFSITGSPVTGNGTIDIEFTPQLANKVFIGPPSAPGSTPTFRVLQSADFQAGLTLDDVTLTSVAGVNRIDAHFGQLFADTDGATITFNMQTADKHTVTLAGNRTLAVSNVQAGQVFTIVLVQDATPPRTVTWFSGIKWPGGTVPTLTNAANKADVFTFLCSSAGNYYGFVTGQNF